MIREAHSVNDTIQTAIGKYEVVRFSYISDTLLTGKVLRFNPGIYTEATPPVNLNIAFKIIYPTNAGSYEFTKINCKNHKAFIEVFDGYNFTIIFKFFVSRNLNGWIPDAPQYNSNAFDSSDFTGKLGFYLKVSPGDETSTISSREITIKGMDAGLEFDDDGFIPDSDLEVNITTSGTVSNNFYLGFIKMDSISNSIDIIPGLVLNYSQVGNGIILVEDFANSCFKSGFGFINNGIQSTAQVTIDGACLKAGSSYKLYAVYYQDGLWKSSISKEIVQKSIRPGIEPTVTFYAEDNFGNSTDKSCLSKLAKGSKFDLKVTIDIADYENKLDTLGYRGTFDDYLESVKVYEANSLSASSGLPLGFINSFPEYSVEGFKSESSKTYVIFQFTMNFPGYKDIIYIPFELTYDAVETEIDLPVYDPYDRVYEMCSNGEYTIVEDFTSCLVLTSIDGSNYTENSVIDGNEINLTQVPDNSEVCIKAICSGTLTGGGGGSGEDCVCPECSEEQISVWITQSTCSFGLLNGNIVCYHPEVQTIEVSIWDEDHQFQLFTAYENTTTVNFNVELPDPNINNSYNILYETISVVLKNGCRYILSGDLSIHSEGENPGDCEITQEEILVHDGTSINDCGCEETAPVCNNFAAIDFTCDEETETVEVSVVTNYESELDEDELLCSFDGGVTFIPCPASITGEANIFIEYNARFADGCNDIHLEQVISCIKPTACLNNRTLELDGSDNTLEITITDSFESDVVDDVLFVSLDGGKTYTTYVPADYEPISIVGNESIIVYTETMFEDGCNDLHIVATLDLSSDIETEECEGYAGYDLSASYDKSTGKFTITKSGSETGLIINELLFTLNLANPFDSQNSGIPYSEPVEGEGNLIARWKIKKPNCSTMILDAFCYGSRKAKVICVLNRCTGNEYIVSDIDLLSITDPGADLEVIVNTTVQTYVSGEPQSTGQYTITEAGKLKFFVSFSNATIKIIQYPYL